jgi:hypothetical protein
MNPLTGVDIMTYQDIREQCVDAAVSAIEFCGDPKEAAIDEAADNGVKLTATEISDILFGAWAVWNSARKQAGVKQKHNGKKPWHYLA